MIVLRTIARGTAWMLRSKPYHVIGYVVGLFLFWGSGIGDWGSSVTANLND